MLASNKVNKANWKTLLRAAAERWLAGGEGPILDRDREPESKLTHSLGRPNYIQRRNNIQRVVS
jgi:hypothetical protein